MTVDAAGGEMAQHVVLFGEATLATFERALKVFSVLVARGDVFGEVALVGACLRAVGIWATECLLGVCA